MTMTQADDSTSREPLRLWPGVVLVVLQWLGWWAVPIVLPDATFYGILGGLLAGPILLVWWAFFSRAPRFERWGAVALVIVAMAATPRLLHESVATGNMGMQFFLWGIPVVSLWAGLPHYINVSPNPRGALALVQKLVQLIGVPLDEQPLRESTVEFEERISKLVASDAELSEYVRQLKKREFAN